MTPIEKNIRVVDADGKPLEPTYPKRAKGLVKKGRARYVSEQEICLQACPPNEHLEDKNMNNQAVQTGKAGEPTETAAAAEGDSTEIRLTMGYVLSRIDLILNDTAHIHEAIAAIQKMEPGQPSLNAPDTSRIAITNVVQARETTNQQMIRLLEKMYDDLKPKEPSEDIQKLQQLNDVLCRFPKDVATAVILKVSQQMFVKAGAEIVK